MKISILILLASAMLLADRPCTPQLQTEKQLSKEFPYNIVIDKSYSDDGCGYRTTELKVFQNTQLVDKLEASYGIDILFIGDINNDKKTEIVYTGHTGGHGTDEHRVAVIEPIMQKPFAFNGFALNLVDIDHDGSMEFVSSHSPFFCITSDFCSHGTSLGIQVAMQFKNNSLVLDKEGMNVLKKESARPCDTNVLLTTIDTNDQSVEFTDNECAKNTLETIAYDLYIQDSVALKTDLKYFIFESNEAKKVFKHTLLNELTKFDIVPASDFDIETRKLIEEF